MKESNKTEPFGINKNNLVMYLIKLLQKNKHLENK